MICEFWVVEVNQISNYLYCTYKFGISCSFNGVGRGVNQWIGFYIKKGVCSLLADPFLVADFA